MEKCSAAGCEKPVTNKKRGLCQMHYMRLRRTGDVDTVRPRGPGRPRKYERIERVCKECGKQFTWIAAPHTKGFYCSQLCSNRATKNGRHRRGEDHPNWKGGHVDRNGYRMIHADRESGKRKLIAEHRYVMEQYLGRELLPTETVHHRNGDKQDNRLENLELWSSRHPRGQRVEDILAFSREMIALYG